MWPQNFQTHSAVFFVETLPREGSLSQVQQTKKQKQKQKKKFKKSLGLKKQPCLLEKSTF